MTDKKTIIITGSNAGIGFTTALQAARAKQRVVMACRNESKAEKARDEILELVPDAEIMIRVLDLSSFDSIRRFATVIAREFNSIDALINNAGIFPLKEEYTADGFEMQLGVNYLGHFLLTHLLIPALSRSPQARIVHMSSIGHAWGNIRPETFRGRRLYLMGMPAYGQSKLANVMFSGELSKRLPTNITSNAVHPGYVESDFFRSIPRAIYALWRHVLVSPETSAKFTVDMALSDAWEIRTGEFVSAQGPLPKNPRLKNVELSRQLYEESCRLTGVEPLQRNAVATQVE